MLVDGHYKTQDMALAVALRLFGFVPTLEMHPTLKRVAVWSFSPERQDDLIDTDDYTIGALVDEYNKGELEVEPKTFMLKQKEMRDELYGFLGIRSARRTVDIA